MMLANSGPPGEDNAASARSASNAASGAASEPDLSDPVLLRAELDRLRAREREMVQLLHADSPERLLHDLRNVLNELQLLRMLADDKV